jgi:hypothetical protein
MEIIEEPTIILWPCTGTNCRDVKVEVEVEFEVLRGLESVTTPSSGAV